MSWTFLSALSSLAVAIFIGYSATVLLKRFLQYKNRPDIQELERSLTAWPGPFPRFASVIGPLIPLFSRFVRPSVRVRRELAMANQLSQFDDVEFVKMQFILGFFCLVVAFSTAVAIELFSVGLSIYAWVLICTIPTLGGFYLPLIKLRDQRVLIERRVQRGFPSFLDVLALALESGQNFQSALLLSVQHFSESPKSPGLKTQLLEVLRSIRSGQSRMEALRQLSDRLALPEITQFVASIAAAEKQGVSVTSLLRRQADQLRTSRALAAERHAMKLPVKLLAPLAVCIFPCTFLVLGFPIGVQLSRSGLF